MSEQIIFKSQTFGGFNKDDVLEYINLLNAQHTNELTVVLTEVENLNKELSAKKDECEEGQKSFDELMTAYNELRSHYLMIKERCSNLEAENDKLKEVNASTEKELQIEKELNSRLEDKIEEQKRADEEKKNEGARILSAVSGVESSAKDMLDNAKNGAKSIIRDAKASAESFNNEIDGFCSEVEKTKNFMQDSLSMLMQRLDYIKKSAEDSKFCTEGGNTRLGEIENAYAKIASEAEKKTEAIKTQFFQ